MCRGGSRTNIGALTPTSFVVSFLEIFLTAALIKQCCMRHLDSDAGEAAAEGVKESPRCNHLNIRENRGKLDVGKITEEDISKEK